MFIRLNQLAILSLVTLFSIASVGAALAAETGKVTGKILTADNAPAANCPIRVIAAPSDTPPDQRAKYSVLTDKSGEFVIENVKAGSYMLYAGPGRLGKTKAIEVEAGKEVRVELQLPKPR